MHRGGCQQAAPVSVENFTGLTTRKELNSYDSERLGDDGKGLGLGFHWRKKISKPTTDSCGSKIGGPTEQKIAIQRSPVPQRGQVSKVFLEIRSPQVGQLNQ